MRITTPTLPTTKQARAAGYNYFDGPGFVAAHTITVGGKTTEVGDGYSAMVAWEVYREIHPAIAGANIRTVRSLCGAFMDGFDTAWREAGSPRSQ